MGRLQKIRQPVGQETGQLVDMGNDETFFVLIIKGLINMGNEAFARDATVFSEDSWRIRSGASVS